MTVLFYSLFSNPTPRLQVCSIKSVVSCHLMFIIMITALKVVNFCANSKQLVTMRDCFQLDRRNVKLMVECCAAVRLSTIRHVIAALMVRVEYISIHKIHVRNVFS